MCFIIVDIILHAMNMYFQAYYGHSEILSLLLPLFPNTNIKEDTGKTPLHLASCKGHRQCVELLLRHGAFVSVQVRLKRYFSVRR